MNMIMIGFYLTLSDDRVTHGPALEPMQLVIHGSPGYMQPNHDTKRDALQAPWLPEPLQV